MGDIPKPYGIPERTDKYKLPYFDIDSPSYYDFIFKNEKIKEDFIINDHEKGIHAPFNTKKESKVNNNNETENSYLPSFNKLTPRKLF
tara:strand:- start:828 stop:1091 length:264 start_codon:yes stop_codon:yes gene_type:complete